MRHSLRLAGYVLAAAFILALTPTRALAHCDTLDGPVVKDARLALEGRDVSPVLKWVKAGGEGEVREAFKNALAVRALGPAARDLADRFFFETVVRVHREGEGAVYTGLKPAGLAVDTAVAASDRALETGSVDALARMVAAEAEQGIRERFAQAAAMRPGAGESVEKGRVYVAAYVEFMHYAERLHRDATTGASHGEHEGGGEAHRH